MNDTPMPHSGTAAYRNTVLDTLREALARRPETVCVDMPEGRHSVAEFERNANSLANGLKLLGVSPGDRVCLILDNSNEHLFLWFAILKLGAVSVPINTAFKGEFLRHQIADCGAKVVVVEDYLSDGIVQLAGDLDVVRTLITRGRAVSDQHFECLTLAEIYSSDTSCVDTPATADDLAMIFYTSGTTGPSKGCMLSHGYFNSAGIELALAANIRAGDTFWTAAPLFHLAASGMFVGCLYLEATFAGYPGFSVSNFWPEIARTRATVVMLVSSMINYVADAPDSDAAKRCYGQLRVVVGAPFTADLKEKFARRFGVQCTGNMGFGMTECCPISIRPLVGASPEGSCGAFIDVLEPAIRDDEGRPVGVDVPGEITVRAKVPNVMFQGYWQRPEETAAVMRDGWFHTGDIGKMDAHGNLYFIDRKKDYLRRGGENISSFEMEASCSAHPDIANVAVHAVRSNAEDDVKVTAVKRPGSDLTEIDFCRWLADRVPYFAVPRYVEFREDLPRNGVGRTMKYLLRDEGVTPTTWDRHASEFNIRRATRERVDAGRDG